jgi:hypothetical protein
MIKLKDLRVGAVVVAHTHVHGDEVCDVMEIDTRLKAWGKITVKVDPRGRQIPYWVDRSKLTVYQD